MRMLSKIRTKLGLRGRLFGMTAGLLLAMYAVGLFVSSYDLRENFEREYTARTALVARVIEAEVAAHGGVADKAHLQELLDQMQGLSPYVREIRVYELVEARPQVIASTNRDALGREGDARDIAPLFSGRTVATERALVGEPQLEINAPLRVGGRPVATIGIYASLAPREALVRFHLLKFAAMGLLALVILLALLGVYLEESLLGPLTELSGAAAQIAGGEMDTQVKVTGAAPEVAELAYAFNAMARSVGRFIGEQDRLVAELRGLHTDTIRILAAAIDARVPHTHGHSDKVARFAAAIAAELGLGRAEIERLRIAALLHDVGKLGVPDRILLKPGPLDALEWAAVRSHPLLGVSVLERVAGFRPVVPVVRHHHERYQGGGYPNGLREAEIPLGARILAVADAFDAMTSERPYRPAFTAEAAVAELVRLKGVQFDPEVIDAFQRAWEAGRIFYAPGQS